MNNEFIQTPKIALPTGRVFEPAQIGKYLSGKSESGELAITADAKPWVRISYRAAVAASRAVGLKLQPESLRVALAYDAYHQPENWTSGIVGEGAMFIGLHKWTVNEAIPATYVSSDPEERRSLFLSNGEEIFDLIGNAFEYTFDDVQGDEEGLVAKPFAEDSISICLPPVPSMEKSTGWYPSAGTDWSGYELIRGGCWDSEGYAGAFRLDRGWPDYGDDYIGFRCTK